MTTTIRLYSRVSTRAQADDGESLEAQQRALRAYVELHGLLGPDVGDLGLMTQALRDEQASCIVDYVDRAVTGSKPLAERPEGARLLAELR